jgi:hypothetical protein
MGSMQIMSGVVKLRIGDPVDTSRLTLKDRSTLTHALREKVGELLMNESVSEPQKTR